MTMRMSARAKFFLYLFLIFMVILTVIPLLYTVSASFKTNMEIATGGINLIPKTFTFDNYKTVWGMSGTGIASKVTYTDYTINSIKVSLMTVVLVVLFTSMSAYCFQRGNFPGRKFLYWLFMATMFIGAGTVTMFPLLRITTKLGLNNLPGLALVQFGTAGASDLFLTMGYLKTISKELDDAAKIDGCSDARYFVSIVIPLSKAVISVLALYYAVGHWNSYMDALLYMLDTKKYPLQLLIRGILLKNATAQMDNMTEEMYQQMKNMADLLKYALIIVSSLPVLIIYPFAKKYFMKGVMIGAVKG